MNMQPAITKKQPSTIRAVAVKRPGIMPTLPMATICMPLTMQKKPQSITPKSTAPSRTPSTRSLKAAWSNAAFDFPA
jgi:hypothetical protein